MNPGETEDRARRRFAVLLAHLIEHTRSHAAELAEGRPVLAADAAAARLLDEALENLAAAHRSLDALAEQVGRALGGEAHPHAHAHGQSHPHSPSS